MEKINLAEKLASFSEQWSPRVVAELNGQQVKLVKVQGTFLWHHHDVEDELFLVVSGRLRMDFRDGAGDREVWLGPGEAIVVPRGVEHRPHADEVTSILLFEPASTVATGNLAGDFVWHRHDDTDELFIVLHGEMEVGFRDRDVTVHEGEMIVVPRGVEHITRARAECHALIIEPRGVVNTGNAGGALTAAQDAWI